MEIEIEVPEEIVRQAAARGIGVAEYVAELLAEAATHRALPPHKELSDEEFFAHIEALARFSDQIPDLPTSAFSREAIYNDRSEEEKGGEEPEI